MLERAAAAWVLLVVLALVLGLLVLVVALGVARHLRRPRRPDHRGSGGRSKEDEAFDDADHPTGFSRRDRHDEED